MNTSGSAKISVVVLLENNYKILDAELYISDLNRQTYGCESIIETDR